MDGKMPILAALGFLLYLILLVNALRAKSPVLSGVISMFLGATALVAANMFGFAVAVNIFTVLVSLTLGIPGVALMLVMIYIM